MVQGLDGPASRKASEGSTTRPEILLLGSLVSSGLGFRVLGFGFRALPYLEYALFQVSPFGAIFT